MDTRHPHDIVHRKKQVVEPVNPFDAHVQAHGLPQVQEPRRWLPLTDAEAKMLEPLTPDQRAAWFKRMPITERLRRFLKAEDEEKG